MCKRMQRIYEPTWLCTVWGIYEKNVESTLMKKNKVQTIEKGFEFFPNMISHFYMKDWLMHKQGIVNNDKKNKEKYKYKLIDFFKQMKELLNKEERIELLKKLKEAKEKILKKYNAIGEEEGGRTIEKDFKVIAWGLNRRYCEDLIEKVERIKKKEIETKKIEDLYLNLELKMYVDTRKEMREQTKVIKEKAITQRLKRKKKKKVEKQKVVGLADLKKNLITSQEIMIAFFQIKKETSEKEIFNTFIETLFNLNVNIVMLNMIISKYNVEELEETLLFLEEKKRNFHSFLELKKKIKEKNNIPEAEVKFVQLQLKYYQQIYEIMVNFQENEYGITLKPVEQWFEELCCGDIYKYVFVSIIENFENCLRAYLDEKEYENFSKESFFFQLREDLDKHWSYIDKIDMLQKSFLFSGLLMLEILLLEKEGQKEKTEIEQLFFDFKKEHYNRLLARKECVSFTKKHLQDFHEKIIIFKQKKRMSAGSETFFLELKMQIKRFGLLIRRVYIKDDINYNFYKYASFKEFLFYEKKYFVEIEHLIQNLPTKFEKDMCEFLEEQIKSKKEELINMLKSDLVEILLLKVELNHYIGIEKAIKTNRLEVNKELTYLENLVALDFNNKKIFTLFLEFRDILLLLKKTDLQTEEGKKEFQACESLLIEHIKQWKSVWKKKTFKLFTETIQDALQITLNSLENGKKDNVNLVEQLLQKIAKKHGKMILKELKTGSNQIEYLNIDFAYIHTFLEEYVVLNSYALKE